jgi:hypothetical protein
VVDQPLIDLGEVRSDAGPIERRVNVRPAPGSSVVAIRQIKADPPALGAELIPFTSGQPGYQILMTLDPTATIGPVDGIIQAVPNDEDRHVELCRLKATIVTN